jgi:hypothetical protein
MNEHGSDQVGDEAETMYAVLNGSHYNNRCCFDYGNAEVQYRTTRPLAPPYSLHTVLLKVESYNDSHYNAEVRQLRPSCVRQFTLSNCDSLPFLTATVHPF